jgi:hypothetical protein
VSIVSSPPVHALLAFASTDCHGRERELVVVERVCADSCDPLERRDLLAIAAIVCGDERVEACACAGEVDGASPQTLAQSRRPYAPPALGEIEPRRDPLPPPPIEQVLASRLHVTNLGTLLDVLA